MTDASWVYRVDLSGAAWRRPSSLPPGDEGIEVAFHGGIVAVRNPACVEVEPHRYTPQEWDAFMRGVRSGEFRLPVA